MERIHLSEGKLTTGMNNAGKILKSLKTDTTSHGGCHREWNTRNRWHGQKQQRKTVRGGEAG